MAGKEIAVKKYVVRLDAEERDRLNELICKGKRSAQLADEGAHPAEGRRFGGGRRLERQPTRRGAGHQHRHCRADQAPAGRGRVFEAVLARKYNSNSARRRISDGAAEAKLIALTLSPAPEGFARWSLRLLEEKVVEPHIVERASDNTIGRTLKNILKPHRKQQWVSDPARRQCGVCRHHGRRPGSLSATARSAAPARVPRRNLEAADHRHARADPRQTWTTSASRLRNTNAMASPICSWCSGRSLEGWRHVKVTDRHTAIDYAHVLRDLSDTHFPDAAKIVLVQDNLNIHKPALDL